jgi:hypothetical protein
MVTISPALAAGMVKAVIAQRDIKRTKKTNARFITTPFMSKSKFGVGLLFY